MMDNIFFADASLENLDEVVAIYNSTISSRVVTADLDPVSVESRISWFYEHKPGKRPLWIVKNKEDIIIGWVSFQDFYGRPAYDTTAEISIYLDSDYRGKGFGKQILKYSLTECVNLGIKTLLGYIFAHNEPSLQVFYKAGFAEWAHLPNIALLDGIERSLKILGKRV